MGDPYRAENADAFQNARAGISKESQVSVNLARRGVNRQFTLQHHGITVALHASSLYLSCCDRFFCN